MYRAKFNAKYEYFLKQKLRMYDLYILTVVWVQKKHTFLVAGGL